MKTFLRLTLGSVLCVLLASCVVTSDNPLSPPETAQADPRFIGDWLGKKENDTYRFTQKQGAWMHVEIIPAQKGDKVDTYDFYPTTIGKNTFLNVVMVGKDDQGKPIKTFTFVRYEFSGNQLQMWTISQDAAAAAVRAGKLKGVVHQDKNPMMVGTPPHPDVDVNLSGSSANLVKLIQRTNVDAFFSDKMETLERVTQK